MKYTAKHGSLWVRVDRIQTAPDMRRTVYTETQRKDYYLKNGFRL